MDEEGFWRPEPIFLGQTVFLLGCGSSLINFDFSRLRQERCLAINGSGHDAPWAAGLFFFDTKWFADNENLVHKWNGLAISPSEYAKQCCPSVKHIQLVDRDDFAVAASPIKRGRTSGHTAVSVAIAMGATRIVLLGFDCKSINGRSHYHDRYKEENLWVYQDDFLPAWSGYREAARKVGVEIVNAGPDSAIKEFQFIHLDTLLK